MKTLPHNKHLFLAVFTGIVIALSVAGCSDDEGKKTTAAKVEHNPFDHSHDIKVTDVQKHKFEHDFAEQCVRRELEHSTNKRADEERWRKPCMCIATYLMKDLTSDEAEKFIGEHKNTQSLVIKFENAAYQCIQAKVQPKGPDLFGRR